MAPTIPEVRLTEAGHVAVRSGADDWMVLDPDGEVTVLDTSELPPDATRLVPAARLVRRVRHFADGTD